MLPFAVYLLFIYSQRVMPTSFFILLRLFMRVDDVIVRLIDTRLYHEVRYKIKNCVFQVTL